MFEIANGKIFADHWKLNVFRIKFFLEFSIFKIIRSVVKGKKEFCNFLTSLFDDLIFIMTDLVIRVAGLRVPDGEGLVPGDVGQVGGRAEVHGALPIPPRVPNARSPGLFDSKSTRII